MTGFIKVVLENKVRAKTKVVGVIDLKEYIYIQPGACQHRKFLGNCWILREQLIDLKEFFKKLC
jgi:hypothetical protein